MTHKKNRGIWLNWLPQGQSSYLVSLFRGQIWLCNVVVDRQCLNRGSVWVLVGDVLGVLWRHLDGTYLLDHHFDRLWDEAEAAGATKGLSLAEAQNVCDKI